MGATASERIEKTTFPLPNEDSPDFAAFRELKLVKRLDCETLMDLMRYGLLAWSVPQRQWPELARSIACHRSDSLAAAAQASTERIVGDRKHVAEGTSVEVRVSAGGRGYIKTKN